MSPAKSRKTDKTGRVRVTLTGGWAGKSGVQVANLRALGLRRSGDVRELPDTPDIRGKIEIVKHLVDVQGVL